MIKTRIFELYYRTLKKPTIINGLVLHPFMVDDKIIWELENPNDLSFSSYVVESYLEDLIYNFFEINGISYNDTGLDWGVISEKYCRISVNDIYINDNLREKINDSLENLNTINFSTSDGTIDSECYVKNWNVSYIDENLYFQVDLELQNPKIDGVDVDYDEVDDFLKDFQYDDDTWEIETEIVDEQLSFFTGDKNLFSDGFMVYNGSVTFYDTFGIRLGY